ncbi:hypothetical protein P3342_009477 [Pyrenophora teres f. teres]|nr:hypothetical protein P3342_009477 [Pyrenophora teres f. teres]
MGSKQTRPTIGEPDRYCTTTAVGAFVVGGGDTWLGTRRPLFLTLISRPAALLHSIRLDTLPSALPPQHYRHGATRSGRPMMPETEYDNLMPGPALLCGSAEGVVVVIMPRTY